MKTPRLDLVSGAPFWPIADGLLAAYPPLGADEQCEVVVVGSGITGALVADELTHAGIDVVVVDRRDAATGSTAATTALVTWELDIELTSLARRRGLEDAVRAYRASVDGVRRIARLAGELPGTGYAPRPSLYLARRESEVPRLEREAALRTRAGLPSEFWSRRRLGGSTCFDAPAAIRSEVCAEIDPYRFAHALLARAASLGARIYDRTDVVADRAGVGGLRLRTARGRCIRADRAVIAPGYEIPAALRRRIVRLRSTYALASEPAPPIAGWDDRCLVWETTRPYYYLRRTADDRIMIGGADEEFRNPVLRDRLIPRKAGQLIRRLRATFPGTPLEPAFAWTGTFGESPDGLPYIGEAPDAPRRLYALGYGANGITAAAIAAGLIRDWCRGEPNELAHLYRLDRETA